jgi:hypothetical protein
MASDPGGGDYRPSEQGRPEPTFADVMNGFSFDTGRTAKRRRWGRRRDDEQDQQEQQYPREDQYPRDQRPPGPPPADMDDTIPPPGSWPPGPPSAPGAYGRPIAREPEYEPPPVEVESSSASVRPYAWTRGRTRSGYELQLETLVSTSLRGRDELGVLAFEHRSVAELCAQVHSVAEVAALLSVPLGVAKVLVGDMAGMGLVVVHQSGSSNGDAPDLALMERVLSGLRRL